MSFYDTLLAKNLSGGGGGMKKVKLVGITNKKSVSVNANSTKTILSFNYFDMDDESQTQLAQLPEYDFAIVEAIQLQITGLVISGYDFSGNIIQFYVQNITGSSITISADTNLLRAVLVKE